MDDKLLINPKFLEEVKRAALSKRDDAIPYANPDLWVSMMWTKAVVCALHARGYKIEKKDAT